MSDEYNAWMIITYTLVVFFIIIGILTIAITFFEDALKKIGIGVSPKIKNILFVKLILEVIGIGFFIFYMGPPNIGSSTTIPGHMNTEVYNLYNKAFEQYAKSNYQASIDLFSEAIQKDPKNYLLPINRSVVYLKANQTTEAINDLNLAEQLYENLSNQQKRRERFYKLLILNQRVSAYVAANEYQTAYEVYQDNVELIDDTTDTLMRLFNNIGNAYYNDHKWVEAADAYSKTFALSKSLGNAEMQITASLNKSNSFYWINGQNSEAIDSASHGIQLLNTFNIGVEKDAELRAGLINAQGLAQIQCQRSNPKCIYKIEDIVEQFSNGIALIEPYTDRTETEFLTYANLIANRAEAYLILKNFHLAENDYLSALNKFINRRYQDGISRQLIGLYKLKEAKKFLTHKELYSLIVMANQLGTNKPSKQQEEDQQLLASISTMLSDFEQQEVKMHLSTYLESATGVPKNTWEQF